MTEGPVILVRCLQCGQPVTRPLKELGDTSLLRTGDGEPYLPKGHILLSDPRDDSSDIVCNLDDQFNIANHPDYKRLQGCCGMDGCDGPNKTCAEGHEIGTENSDCWMPHAILFHKSLTRIDQVEPNWQPFDPAWLRWNDGAAVAIAQKMYDDRDFSSLPILADALEEAGCTSADILTHCRQPGEHVRGCWVVDLMLGKS